MNDTLPASMLTQTALDRLCIDTIRTLAMDAVQKANSGHPGTPMALAPLAYVLWTRFLRYNPRNPEWFDRDRFVLSAGHASMLLYAVLHLTGYDLSLDEIRRFRQWGSKTPGHAERGQAWGIEATTGPLGQGLANSVGMAIAEAHLAARFNRPGHELVNHRTWVICSDGDLMEGISHEAASLAGHLGLNKLIWIYDDNHISIEGDTALATSDDVAKRFESYRWHVQNVGDRANDLAALNAALANACSEDKRPSLVIVRSHIGYGAPHAQDTAAAHGAPLGEEEVRLAKAAYNWPEHAKFLVPPAAGAHMGKALGRGAEWEQEWEGKLSAYWKEHPQLAARFEAALEDEPAPGWEAAIPRFDPAEGPIATRTASGKTLNAIAANIPWLMGGAGDLAPSTSTRLAESGDFERGDYGQRNLHWGVREHAMCAASSGMALHGGVRPYAATFFIFSDYARPAIRLAALMGLPVIYVMTHDSIGLGEDGPTHQPVEHLASFRAMPNLCVIRPADANEAACAWRATVERRHSPTMLVLTRQTLPVIDRRKAAAAEGLLQGAYVLSKEPGARLDVILIASGSEVHLALGAQARLDAESGVSARVVSMPSWELFREQPQRYRDQVLPPATRARLAVEAASPMGWREWVGDEGAIIGVSWFGASAPAAENFRHYGLTVERVTYEALQLVGK